ncbi:hydroxymethylpyrimidine/phosphomethylpyrimidine kinase [Paucimonas lemoignei]|uniref:hydroxymethylpyrimidine kinase n=1 Tax=Paucimonas lemoignei TaxID=29443 RepID=A0A4R3HPJ9_PAULE|nr:hydroxymethylpyrimidine/phosphomethylpyrimidine kinase [Paucimonas lemoignei]TCS33508.1 hydroxymethylpyrimidine/phosphomethylpyrimidine kinase [Paucimonas lemoignei]
MKRASVLVFSGSDPSGGAGMQADVQAIAALGAHPLSVLTSLTVQDNDRVYAVHPVPAALLTQQAQVLIDKIDIAAVKIGIVGNRANAEAIAEIIQQLRQSRPDLPVVLDPVLASGHGDALALDDAVSTLAPLMALATLVTPNLPEATVLSGGDRRIDSQAEVLLAQGCNHVLIKGGHAHDDKVVNRWFSGAEFRSWTWPRLPGSFHGSGCTLAAATAALLASGKPMAEAIEDAQMYCHQALEHAYAIADGQLIPSRPRPYMKAA